MANKLYTFQWFLRPDRDKDWFENEKTRLAPDAFAREILINYDFSVSGVVFSEFTNDHIFEGPYEFNPDLPVYRALDFGRTCAALFAQRDSYGRFIFFKEVVLEPSSTTELGATVRDLSYEYASHVAKPFDVCDPAGTTVNFTASNMEYQGVKLTGAVNDISILNTFGIFPRYDKLKASRERLKDGITLVKYLLSERNSSSLPNIRVVRQGCPTLVEAFQSGYRYKVNKATGETLDTIDERHPYEDVMDCLRYTLMQFSTADPNKKSLNLTTTKFTPTRNPAWKPIKGQNL